MIMQNLRHRLMSNFGAIALNASRQINRVTGKKTVKEQSAHVGNKPTNKRFKHMRKLFPTPFNEHQEQVNKMTNWQRTQWARERRQNKGKMIPNSGYQSSLVQRFLDLERPTS